MNRIFNLLVAASSMVALGALQSQGAVMVPLTSFGGGDGWRSPDEVLVGDTPGTDDGGFYKYLAPGDAERGFAYNPVTGNLILVSRNEPNASDNGLRILDGATGVDIGSLNKGSSIITGGTFATNMVAVADDGAIYVANLTTNTAGAGGNFKVYRWASETATAPTVAYDGDPLNGARLGDTFDAIGSGANTRLVAGYGTFGAATQSNSFALLDTADGLGFTASNVTIASDPPSNGDFRLGITFQDDDTVIGRTPNHLFARIVDVAGSTGTLSGSFATEGSGITPIDFAEINGMPLLAGVNINNSTTFVYDISEPFDMVDPNPHVVMANATSFFNPNPNATGQVKFGAVNGNNVILYALNTRNGIQAFEITLDPPAGGVDGDFNNNGTVDAADYVLWRKLDGTNTPLANDGNLGTPISAAHYNLWKENFGETSGAGAGANAGAVPEPSSMVVLAAVGLALAGQRRSR